MIQNKFLHRFLLMLLTRGTPVSPSLRGEGEKATTYESSVDMAKDSEALTLVATSCTTCWVGTNILQRGSYAG